MQFDKSNAFEKEKNVQKQLFKKPAKSWARKTIKQTPKSMTNSKNKEIII